MCSAVYTIETEANAFLTLKIAEIEAKINELSEDITQILRNQAENNRLLQQVLKKCKSNNTFPITSREKLNDIEEEIEEKKDEYSNVIEKILWPVGLIKGLERLITIEVILQFNFDGLQDKLAFKKYEAFNNVLYGVLAKIHGDGYNKKEYEKEIKLAWKLAKNRFYKNTSIAKNKKLANSIKMQLSLNADEGK